MSRYDYFKKELKALYAGTCEYEWDELEELIADDFDEEKLSSDEYDALMRELMAIDQ